MDDADKSPVMTVDEAAALLRIGRNSAYEAARRGEIPTLRIGRRLLVLRAALDRLLNQGRACDALDQMAGAQAGDGGE